MRIKINAVTDSPTFPEQVDVVVIGGGIIGTSVAYELAKQGVSVALFEKGVIGGEQSGRNWGWVRQQNRDLYELPLAMRSLQRWEELGNEIGLDLGFRRSGILYGTQNEADVARWEKWGKQAKQIGFVSHLLSPKEVYERLGEQARWAGGIWSPTDGRAEPSLAAAAIAVGAQKLGASLHQRCAVRGLDISAGRVSGVWTERGRVRASQVICCGGAWSSRFCKQYGIDLPSANILGTAFKTTAAPEVIQGCLSMPELCIRRRLDGSYTVAIPGRGQLDLAPQNIRYATKFYPMYRSKIAKKLKLRLNGSFFNGPEAAGSWSNNGVSPFEKIRVLDPKPDRQILNEALGILVKAFPALEGIKIDHAWGGWIDTTPDLVPVIDEMTRVPGLFVASGFSGHGFGIGPGAGLLCAQLMTNRQRFTDIAPYRLARFDKGNAIREPQMM
ncbi:FAD-binding oxidoreductase [Pantoea sp. ACRSH]|uniref:NAD(P)/FAD-dependent oxidoreductase n=1 Tax=unclassified Pantoea TaxID=2630326 RepID=UPI001EF5C9D3|nr:MULTISPECIES: FAD-binding oxidoreductase [unclassified Pantoea]MCG7367665.1 FAD-binding oxidoreductase [Pantoea sp. ACRSH]MCG7398748.1 FAD-binding oxidoreductase [Pantoea sp. ACRSC]